MKSYAFDVKEIKKKLNFLRYGSLSHFEGQSNVSLRLLLGDGLSVPPPPSTILHQAVGGPHSHAVRGMSSSGSFALALGQRNSLLGSS